jgi:hypothetical protein
MRLKFALTHLAVSALVVGIFLVVVLLVLFPAPIARLEGVYAVLALVIVVDVCLGPLLTGIVANPKKPRRELARDLSLIALVQLAALGYGAYSVVVARPAFVVFNTDRFDIVTPSELVWREADGVQAAFKSAPRFGPEWVQAVPPKDVAKRNELLFEAVQGGADLKNLPHLFQPWPAEPESVRERIRPLSELIELGEAQRGAVTRALQTANASAAEVGYVPLLGRQATGVVLLRLADAAIVDVLPIAPKY